jgi:hypothetical protein
VANTMMRTVLIVLASLSIVGARSIAPRPRVRYVAPRELVGVPELVRTKLGARHCLIPIGEQGDEGRPSVIRGAFYRTRDPGDWAILCSRPANGEARRSTLIVFGESNGWRADSVGVTMPDHPFPVFSAEDSSRTDHGLDWSIAVAGVALIPRALRECPQRMPECPTHDERRAAMHDGILQGERSDGATTIFYWTGRRWVELPGGD